MQIRSMIREPPRSAKAAPAAQKQVAKHLFWLKGANFNESFLQCAAPRNEGHKSSLQCAGTNHEGHESFLHRAATNHDGHDSPSQHAAINH